MEKTKGIPFIWRKYEKFEGADANIIFKDVKGDSKGVDITGGVKYVDGDSKGVSLTSGLNIFNKVSDWAVMYGTLGNRVKEVVPDESFVVQFGLFNRAGDRYCPLVNVYGLKNLVKKLKRKGEKK